VVVHGIVRMHRSGFSLDGLRLLALLREPHKQRLPAQIKKGPVAGAFIVDRFVSSLERTPQLLLFLGGGLLLRCSFLFGCHRFDSPIEICDLKKIAA